MRAVPILLFLVLLCACAQAPAPVRVPANTAPEATAVGQAISCLTTSEIRDTRVWNDRTIDFHTTGGRTYRNTLPDSCPELGFEERFAYTLSVPRLCSVDIVTVLHSDGTRGASCGLGQFVPVTLGTRR